jgi:hypothetical protein
MRDEGKGRDSFFYWGRKVDNLGLAAVMLLAAIVVIGLPILVLWAIFG